MLACIAVSATDFALPSPETPNQRYIYLGCRIGFWRSRSAFCCALAMAATFRMRWAVIVRSASFRGTRKVGVGGGLFSERSCSLFWKFPIGHASRHSRQRLSAKTSFLLHNVVRRIGIAGRDMLRQGG